MSQHDILDRYFPTQYSVLGSLLRQTIFRAQSIVVGIHLLLVLLVSATFVFSLFSTFECIYILNVAINLVYS